MQPRQNINFRIMEPRDLEKVIDLCNECFDENTSYAYAREIYEKTDKNVQIYVVGEIVTDQTGNQTGESQSENQGTEIVAHALVNIVPTVYEDMNTYAILNHVCVKPSHRRAHLGTRLLDYCFDIAKSKNCKKVELWSKNFRVAAHALYHKYGFEVLEAAFFEKEVANGATTPVNPSQSAPETAIPASQEARQ